MWPFHGGEGSTLPSLRREPPGTGWTMGATSLGHQPLVPSRKEPGQGWGCVGNLYLARARGEQDGRCSICSFMRGFLSCMDLSHHPANQQVHVMVYLESWVKD